jgi:hypothetical protein
MTAPEGSSQDGGWRLCGGSAGRALVLLGPSRRHSSLRFFSRIRIHNRWPPRINSFETLICADSRTSVPDRGLQPVCVLLRLADLTSFTLTQSQRRPRRDCRVEQVVFPNTGWSILQMVFNVRKNTSK